MGWESESTQQQTSRFAQLPPASHEYSGSAASNSHPVYGTVSNGTQMDLIFSGISFSSLANTAKKAPEPRNLGPGGIYHEKQVGKLCAMHSINNLLQENRITEEHLRKTAKQLDKAQQRLTGGRSGDYLNFREDGFYNALVVQAILSGLGFQVSAVRGMGSLDGETAVLANRARHWFAVRRLGTSWFDLNSCLHKPEHYDARDMQEHLNSAAAQGYRLFVVRGEWPATALEQDPGALADAVRGCLRPLGYKPKERIVCSPGLDVMMGSSMTGVGDYRVPAWLQFSAHWFSAARFQHHPNSSKRDWQEAELSFRKKKVSLKKKSERDATLEDGREPPGDEQELDTVKENSIFDDVEEMLEASVDEDEIALEDVPVYLPIFVVLQMLAASFLWLIFALSSPAASGWLFTTAGLETLAPGYTLAETTTDCVDYRWEAWRWWSYQYTHTSVSHASMNVFILLMAGLPLEQFQGHLRIFLLFNVGVFTGALFNMVWNPHSALAGMSAGCYALLFAHFAELGMNWKQSRYRWAKLFVLILVVVLDIVSINVTESQDTSVAAEVVSHTAHMGGAFSGLLLGILITRNLVVLPSERIVHIVALVLWLVILAVHVGWFLQWPPRAMFEGTPWCWARQIFNQTLYGDDRYHCVRCADDACIQSWQGQRWMESVDWRICEYQLGWN